MTISVKILPCRPAIAGAWSPWPTIGSARSSSGSSSRSSACPRPEIGGPLVPVRGLLARARAAAGDRRRHLARPPGLRALRARGNDRDPGLARRGRAAARALLEAVRAAHARGARLVTICSGVFVLAAAGLLDGRRATTHWRYVDRLRARYPRVRVEPDVLYVDEGKILTSAGSAAGIDLCLHLVRRDYGAEIANQVARRLVVPPQRDGGQSQYVPRAGGHGDEGRARPLLEWAQRRLGDDLSVARLARQAAMSPRRSRGASARRRARPRTAGSTTSACWPRSSGWRPAPNRSTRWRRASACAPRPPSGCTSGARFGRRRRPIGGGSR